MGVYGRPPKSAAIQKRKAIKERACIIEILITDPIRQFHRRLQFPGSRNTRKQREIAGSRST